MKIKLLFIIFFLLVLNSCASPYKYKLDTSNITDIDKFHAVLPLLLSDKRFLKAEVLLINASKPSLQRIVSEADELWKSNNLSEANSKLERALRISKEEASIYLRLAHIRLEQGYFKESKAFAARGSMIAELSSWERLLLSVYLKINP